MKKKVVSLLLTGLMVVSAVACGSKKEASTGSSTKSTAKAENVSLTVWSPQEDQDAKWLQNECEKFAKAHTEYKITYKYGVCSEGDAKDTVSKDPTAAADVYMYANDQIPTLVDAGALSELGGDTLAQIKKDNDSAILKTVTYKDGVYGVPFTSNTWFMYYDKSVFSDNDVKSLDTMLEKGKVSFPLTNSWYIASFYLANGCTLFNEGTEAKAGIKFGGDAGTAVTKYLAALVKNPNFKNDADGAGLSGLKDKSINAIFSGSWDYKNAKEALGDNFGVAVVPTAKIGGKDCQLRAFAGSKAIGVNPNCKNQKAAVALAAYLGSKDAQTSHWTARAYVPTVKSVKVTGDGSDMAEVQMKMMTNKYSHLQPLISEMGQYWGPAGDMGNSLNNGEVTDANAADLTEKMNTAMNSTAVK